MCYGHRADVEGIRRSELESVRTHANTYMLEAFLKSACRQIGSGENMLKGEVSVDGTRRSLDMLVNCASIAKHLFRQASRQMFEGCMLVNSASTAHGIVIQRCFDSTPMLGRFGMMTADIAEHARFLKKLGPSPDKPYESWTLVTFEVWRWENP